MNWLKNITQKPWEEVSPEVADDGLAAGRLGGDENKLTAFKFFMAVVTVIFFLFTITFLQRSQSYDFQALAGELWLPFSDTSLLWRSTALLIGASCSIQIGFWQAKNEHARIFLASLLFTILFTFAFVFSQLDIWQHMQVTGFGLTRNPANSYFYLFTTMHGLHLLVGIYVLLTVTFRALLGQSLNLVNVRLTAYYLHFMLGIWLFLFYLLTRDAEAFKTIAAFCGF